MENPPFEDVFPIENGDIPASYVSLVEGCLFAIPQIVAFFVRSRVHLQSILQVWGSESRGDWGLGGGMGSGIVS